MNSKDQKFSFELASKIYSLIQIFYNKEKF